MKTSTSLITAFLLASFLTGCPDDGPGDSGRGADTEEPADASADPDAAVAADAADAADAAPGCGSCHGDPPPPPHPPATSHPQCAWCHQGTVLPNGTIDHDGGLHRNSAVDSNKLHPEEFLDPSVHGHHFNNDGPLGCVICHGEDLQGGPLGASCDMPSVVASALRGGSKPSSGSMVWS